MINISSSFHTYTSVELYSEPVGLSDESQVISIYRDWKMSPAGVNGPVPLMHTCVCVCVCVCACAWESEWVSEWVSAA